MPNNPRLFIELIRSSTGVYPSWQPSQKVELGDFGTVNKVTGLFDTEGSIYDPDFEPQLNISSEHPPESFHPDDKHVVVSRGVKQLHFGADVAAKLPNFADGIIKGRWTFSTGRGAILVLYKPTFQQIRRIAKLLPLIRNSPQLAGKAVVASVYSTPMYAFLLTNDEAKGAEAIVALGPSSAIPQGIVDASAGADFKWFTQSSSGVWKSGGEGGDYTYFPLYDLRTPKTKSFIQRLLERREVVDLEGEDAFYPYQAPWGALDEDGDEIED